MVLIRFRSNDEHEDLMKKVRKMKKFTEELEDILEECYEEEEPEFRGSYRKHYDDEGMRMRESRYSNRGGRM